MPHPGDRWKKGGPVWLDTVEAREHKVEERRSVGGREKCAPSVVSGSKKALG